LSGGPCARTRARVTATGNPQRWHSMHP